MQEDEKTEQKYEVRRNKRKQAEQEEAKEMIDYVIESLRDVFGQDGAVMRIGKKEESESVSA